MHVSSITMHVIMNDWTVKVRLIMPFITLIHYLHCNCTFIFLSSEHVKNGKKYLSLPGVNDYNLV